METPSNADLQLREEVHHRPCLIICSLDNEAEVVSRINVFIRRHGIRTLNVCGHRSDDTARLKGFQSRVRGILSQVFQAD